MIHVVIPGRADLTLRHLVSDLNGTLARDGALLEGVAPRLAQVGGSLTVHILTAGTHGGLERAQDELARVFAAAGAPAPRWEQVVTGADKLRYVGDLGATEVVALGNGANDEPMLRAAGLGIAVLGDEGAYPDALAAAQIVVH